MQPRVAPPGDRAMRLALGVSYAGTAYNGWQSQSNGNTVQDKLESALSIIAGRRVSTLCAGRTDAGVHALMQVVHFDTDAVRKMSAWIRGVNACLPSDIAVHWACEVPSTFHVRAQARSRRYAYVLLESPIRPSVESARVGWVFQPLDLEAMQQAASQLLGTHDFSSFRASACQAKSPVKTITDITISRRGESGSCYWRMELEADAFLHHMIRNIMGCLVAIGARKHLPEWISEVLEARSRDTAAPTFSPDGLYFMGPRYGPEWGLPSRTAAFDWLP